MRETNSRLVTGHKLLKAAGLIFTAMVISLYPARDSKAQYPRPNVLFIAIDDLKRITGYMSEEPGNFLQWIYPDPVKRTDVKSYLTPHIDQLAAQGVAFTNAQCPTPACNPSRTGLMIGIRPCDSGITRNPDGYFRESLNPDIRNAITLSQNLIAQAYYAAGLGKIFHGNRNSDPENSWTDWLNRPWGAKTGQLFVSPWSPSNSMDTNVAFGYVTGSVEVQHDYVNADFIADVLENGSATIGGRTVALPADKPFFLACGIFRPHLPFYAPKELVDLFDANDLALMRQTLDDVIADVQDLSAGGKSVVRVDPDGTISSGDMYELLQHGLSVDPVDGDLKAWRELVRYYLASTAFADRCVGRLLEGLENSPYADNTLVVLWSDHGYSLGEKHRLKKSTLWNEAASCVLIIKDPTQPQTAGMMCRHPVNLQDLYRTISATCGVSVPTHVAGRDISALIANPTGPWDHAALTTIYNDHTIRTDEYRYIRFNDDSNDDELYDEIADPNELDNVITDPYFDPVESQMENRLEAILAYLPPPDPPTGVEANTGPNSGEITLQWNKVSNATGYKVYYDEYADNPPFSPSQEGGPLSGLDVGDVTQVTVSGLTPGETYYFSVVAYNQTGESDYSMLNSATAGSLVQSWVFGSNEAARIKHNELSSSSSVFTVQYEKRIS